MIPYAKFHGQRSVAEYSPWGLRELGMTEHTYTGCWIFQDCQDLKEFAASPRSHQNCLEFLVFVNF